MTSSCGLQRMTCPCRAQGKRLQGHNYSCAKVRAIGGTRYAPRTSVRHTRGSAGQLSYIVSEVEGQNRALAVAEALALQGLNIQQARPHSQACTVTAVHHSGTVTAGHSQQYSYSSWRQTWGTSCSELAGGMYHASRNQGRAGLLKPG